MKRKIIHLTYCLQITTRKTFSWVHAHCM